MKAGVNQVIVKVKKTRNDEIVTGIIDESGNPLVLLKDTDFNPEQNAVIFGEVVAVAEKLAEMEVTRSYDGYPVRSGKFQADLLLYKDLPIEIKTNDRVYFHFHSLDNESFLFKEDGWIYFTVQYNQIFCAVREGEIVPIAGYILVDPYFGEDVEEFAIPETPAGLLSMPKTIKGRKSQSGLITELHEKPKYLEGIIRYVGEYLDFTGIEVKKGDRVLYTIDSDFENEIEGRNYYVMHVWDLFAINNNTIEPVGDWIMIDSDKEPENKSGLIIIKKKPERSSTGKVVSIGKKSREVSVGDLIKFEAKSPNYTSIEGFTFIKEQDIYYKI